MGRPRAGPGPVRIRPLRAAGDTPLQDAPRQQDAAPGPRAPARPPEDPRQREARETLDRVARDSEIMGSSAIARAGRRMGDHFAGRDAVGEAEGGGTDPVELWGRRIGRALSVVGFVVLALWLAFQLGMI
jgi:hypothetical protein